MSVTKKLSTVRSSEAELLIKGVRAFGLPLGGAIKKGLLIKVGWLAVKFSI